MAWYNPTDPQQRNWMIGGIVFLLLIIPYNMYLLSPRQEENATIQGQVENLETQNRRASVLAAQGGGDLQERLALYEAHVDKLEELIPQAEEVSVLLDDIQTRARQVDVDVQELVPQPSEPGQFYDRTSYNMSIIGEYHAVGRFLTEIASLSRIVTSTQVEIQLFGAPISYPELESPVQANFIIETYVLPDSASMAARAAAAAAPAPGA
jgi:type IV pilus assembly protein PilO